MDDQKFFAIALEEAKKGFNVGGLPVCLLDLDGLQQHVLTELQ